MRKAKRFNCSRLKELYSAASRHACRAWATRGRRRSRGTPRAFVGLAPRRHTHLYMSPSTFELLPPKQSSAWAKATNVPWTQSIRLFSQAAELPKHHGGARADLWKASVRLIRELRSALDPSKHAVSHVNRPLVFSTLRFLA